MLSPITYYFNSDVRNFLAPSVLDIQLLNAWRFLQRQTFLKHESSSADKTKTKVKDRTIS